MNWYIPMHVALVVVQLQVGWASQYAEGVMDRVIRTRQAWGQLPADVSGYDGYIAVADCDAIGSTWHLRPLGGEWERFLVTDCASRTDRQSETDSRSGYEWMVSQGIIAEVDYETARRWGRAGRGVKVERLVDD